MWPPDCTSGRDGTFLGTELEIALNMRMFVQLKHAMLYL